MSLLPLPRFRILSIAALFLLVSTGVQPARAALDLTGTWQGTWSCKDVQSGVVIKPKNTLTMTVSQSGGDVHAVLFWDGYATSATFTGHVQELTGLAFLEGAALRTRNARRFFVGLAHRLDASRRPLLHGKIIPIRMASGRLFALVAQTSKREVE